MRREVRLGLCLGVLLLPLGGAGVGMMLSSGILHPARRALTAEDIRQADRVVERTGAARTDFEVTAPDGVKLRGWKFRAKDANGDWVLAFHGVSDNRMGVLGHAEMLLRHGYSVATMDARAHGASEGERATYGWLERNDTRAIVDALLTMEQLNHLYAVGASMGAAIALQSAGVEPRIEAVVAESAFANLREVSYDYASLRLGHWLGRTLFWPAAWMGMRGAEKEGGFKAKDISPEEAVKARAFPVFLICGSKDRNIPCRHTRRIYKAAAGPKEMWLVEGAGHAASFGHVPAEFEKRITQFLASIREKQPQTPMNADRVDVCRWRVQR